MTLKELIDEQYDIICDNQEQVKQVVDVLERNGGQNAFPFIIGNIVEIYKDGDYSFISEGEQNPNSKSIAYNDFLNLAL